MRAKCKICGSDTKEAFRVPSSKLTGEDIPNEPDDCIYFQCIKCNFCFTTLLDNIEHRQIYDENYWENQDPDWYGRISQSLRLVMLANFLLNKKPFSLDILDFGCGMGTFIEVGRKQLEMNIWGYDIIKPKFGREYFMQDLSKCNKKFDIIICCEVLEHLPFPVEIIGNVLNLLKTKGVFAFQTALYDPQGEGRNWWYVGPANGHISLYSMKSLDYLFRIFKGVDRNSWRGYDGVQAWYFGNTATKNLGYFQRLQRLLSKNT